MALWCSDRSRFLAAVRAGRPRQRTSMATIRWTSRLPRFRTTWSSTSRAQRLRCPLDASRRGSAGRGPTAVAGISPRLGSSSFIFRISSITASQRVINKRARHCCRAFRVVELTVVPRSPSRTPRVRNCMWESVGLKTPRGCQKPLLADALWCPEQLTSSDRYGARPCVGLMWSSVLSFWWIAKMFRPISNVR